MDPYKNTNQSNANELPEPVVISPTQTPQSQPDEPVQPNQPYVPAPDLSQTPINSQPAQPHIPAAPVSEHGVNGEFGPTVPNQPQSGIPPSSTWAGINNNESQANGHTHPSAAPPQPTSGQPPAAFHGAPKKRFYKRKAFGITLLVLLVVCVVGAITYAEVIVPNEPANVLKTALINTIQEKKFSFDANGSVDPTSASSGIAVKVEAKGSLDNVNKTSDVNLNVTVSGVTINAEVRYVNQNLYIKPGDLSTLASLVSNFAPGAAAQYSAISSQLSNRWIVVDSTLLKQAGLSCVMNNSSDSLTNNDVKLIESSYAKNPFAAIKSSSSDEVNGKPAEKFVVNVSDNNAAKFTNSFSSVAAAKSISSCESKQGTKASTVKGDNKTTPITVWVDKSSKRIVQIGYTSSSQGVAGSGEKGSFTLGLVYNSTAVTAPASSTPVLTVLTQLQTDLGSSSSTANLSQLFTSFSATTPPTTTILQ